MSIVILSIIMLSFEFSYCYAEYRCAECHTFLLLRWLSSGWMSLCWVSWHPCAAY